MDLLGHIGIALAFYAPVGLILHIRGRTRLAIMGTVLVAGATMFPDADTMLPWFVHRGRTHSVWFALTVGGSLGILAAVIARHEGRTSGSVLFYGGYGICLGMLAVFAHLLGDVITPMGIRPFYPLWDTNYTFNLVLARDPVANARLFVFGCLTTIGQVLLGVGVVHRRKHRPTPNSTPRTITGTWRTASSNPTRSAEQLNHGASVTGARQDTDD